MAPVKAPPPKTGFLARKVGPLPVWAWGAIGIAGLLVGIYIKNRMGRSSTAQSGAGISTVAPSVGDAAVGGGGASGVSPLVNDNPDLLAAIMNAQSVLGDLAGLSVSSSLQLASNVNANSFSFAQSALDKIYAPPVIQYSGPAGSSVGGAPTTVTSTSTLASSPAATGPFGDPYLPRASPIVAEALAAHRAPPGGF